MIEALRGVRVVAIAAGHHHSMALTNEGGVLSFGRAGLGRLGRREYEYGENQLVPEAIEALRGTRVVAIAAGDAHSMVLTDEGVVLSFGRGRFGQLGHGERRDLSRPTKIEALLGERVVAIAAGDWHSMVLTDGGAVLSFGYGADCGLGHRDNDDRLWPEVIEALLDKTVVAIAAGSSDSMVRTGGDGAEVLVCGRGICHHGDCYPFRRHQLDPAAAKRELAAHRAAVARSVERPYQPSRLTY